MLDGNKKDIRWVRSDLSFTILGVDEDSCGHLLLDSDRRDGWNGLVFDLADIGGIFDVFAVGLDFNNKSTSELDRANGNDNFSVGLFGLSRCQFSFSLANNVERRWIQHEFPSGIFSNAREFDCFANLNTVWEVENITAIDIRSGVDSDLGGGFEGSSAKDVDSEFEFTSSKRGVAEFEVAWFVTSGDGNGSRVFSTDTCDNDIS